MGTTPTEEEAYVAFVNTCMHQLHAGLQLDHTDKKQRVAGALQTHVLNKKKSAAERVLEGRFVLGADDSAYLQTGMATLWSTAPTDASTDGLDKGLALAPPGLYTPDAVGGIRAGLVRALKAKTKALERNAPADLAALVPALRLLLETPVIRNAITEQDATKQAQLEAVLAYKWTKAPVDAEERNRRRKEMLEFLRKLKTYLESAKGGKGGAKKIAELILGAVEKQARNLDTVRGELSKTSGLLKQKVTEVARQKKTIVSLQLALGSVRTILETTKNENARITAELQTCEQALTRANALEANLRRLLGESRRGGKVLRAEKDTLDAQVRQLGSELEVVWGALTLRRDELEAARKGVVRFKEERDKFKAGSEAQAAELAEKENDIVAKKQHIILLEEQVKDLTTTLQSANRRSAALTIQNRAQAMKLETQKMVLDDTADGARRAQLEAEDLGAQLAEAKAQVGDLERVRDSIRDEKDALDAQVQQLRSQLKGASDTLTGRVEELVAARKDIVSLREEHDKFKAGSEAQAAELVEKGNDIFVKKQRVVQLEEQVKELTTTQTVLSTKLQSAERRTEELTVQNQDQEVKLEAQKMVLRNTADAARDAQLEAEGLEVKLAEAKAQVDDLERVRDDIRAILANSQSTVSVLEQETSTLRERAEQLQKAMDANDEAKRLISDQLSNANEGYAKLQSDFEECEGRMETLREELKDCMTESEALKATAKTMQQTRDTALRNRRRLAADAKRLAAQAAADEEVVNAGPDWDAWLEQAERAQLVASSQDVTTPSNRPMRNMLVSFILRFSTLSEETFKQRLSTALTGMLVLAVGAAFVTRLVDWATESRALVLYNAGATSEPENLYQMVVANLPALPEPVDNEVAETWYDWASRGARVVYDHVVTAQYTTTNVQSINDANSPGQPTLSAIINAHGDDAVDLSNWVVARGLVGQRGPACAAVAHEADADIAAVDARLEYALPSPEKLGAVLPHLKLLLDGTDEPTEAEVHAALATDDDDDACGGAATAVETLAAFGGNYAVLGEPVDANDDRGGIEVPHAVRWLPATGAAGRAAARVAMLEHVMARCAQLAESDATSTPVKAALREAAATLKLSQMAPLYATREAVAYDEPERSGCWHAPSSASAEHGILVTRPCAIVRGALAFPVDAGIARVACDRRAESVLGDAAEAKEAKTKYHEATLSVRTQARAKGRATNIYVAPPARELRFASAGTTAAATGETMLSEDVEVTEDVTPDDFTTANWLRIVNRALVATNVLVPENDAAVERVEGLLDAVGEEGVTAEQRRDGLWTEFRRHSAISQDRLWVFLRLLSGAVGGEVNEVITTADEATLRATRAIQDQRVQIAKRVSDMQAKIVETVVGSMAKDSKLTLDKNGNQLVVVDAEARKQLSDLASGESGRPFFEANVAVRNLQSSDANAPKPTLSQLLASLSQVGGQMQRSLEQTLTQPGTASASLAELSHPANCYFVTLRPDAVAAIRVAHERMNVELGLRGAGRRLSLWETIEGGCTMLTTRFAEFAGHVLVQARSTTGISAMYVSPQAIHTNASQARVALERLVHVAGAYTMSVGLPNWTALRDKNADLGEARAAIMNAGSTVEDHEVGSMMRRVIQGTPMRSRLSTHRHASGWEIVGLATR